MKSKQPASQIVVKTEHNPVLAAKQRAHVAQIIERHRAQNPKQPTPKKAG